MEHPVRVRRQARGSGRSPTKTQVQYSRFFAELWLRSIDESNHHSSDEHILVLWQLIFHDFSIFSPMLVEPP